jgi:hypothetical protein
MKAYSGTKKPEKVVDATTGRRRIRGRVVKQVSRDGIDAFRFCSNILSSLRDQRGTVEPNPRTSIGFLAATGCWRE